jgi:hypothetical protein
VNPAIETCSCWLLGWLSDHWKLNTLGWLRRFVPIVCAEFCSTFSCAWFSVPPTSQASQHWNPPLIRIPAASICSKKSAGMMWPSGLIAFTPMVFISAICLAVSAAE